MIIFILLFLFPAWTYSQTTQEKQPIQEASSAVTAKLYLKSYDPTVFQLKFSRQVIRPDFQILLNDYNLTYLFLNQQYSNFNSSYKFVIISDLQNIDRTIQTYTLIFNFPLNVANGKLNVGSYSLSPTKAPIKYKTALWPSYILLAFIYSLSLFGIIGITLIDFVQGYILSEYKFVHTTSTYKVLGNAFFFDVPAGIIKDQSYPLKIAVPLIALASSFILAVVIKQVTKNSKSPYLKQVRRFFAYNLFLSVWSVMFIPIIYQGGQYVLYLAVGYVGLSQNKKLICDIISYFNFLTVPLYFYLMGMVMNPKCNQTLQQFQKYTKSEQFKQYQKINKELKLVLKKHRIFFIWITIRKFILITFFFLSKNLLGWFSFLQMIFLFYIFVSRPFKDNFYTQSFIIVNLIIYLFQFVVSLGNSYFKLSDELVTQIAIQNFLLAKLIIFFVICFIIGCFAMFQNFRIFKDIIYEIRIDFQPIPVSKDHEAEKRKRLFSNSSTASNSYISTRLRKPTQTPQKQSPRKRKLNMAKDKINFVQTVNEYEMDELTSPSIRKRLSSKIAIKKLKWKQKNLFEQFASSNLAIDKKDNTYPQKNKKGKRKMSSQIQLLETKQMK